MLIFGLRVCFHTVGNGVFHCQRCGGDRQYRRRAGRRWFHILFIPVIPLDRTGELLQCESCGGRYRTGVLAVPTAAQMEAALPAGTLAAVLCMMLAGDSGNEAARRRSVEAVRAAGLGDFDEKALDRDLAQAAMTGGNAGALLNTLAAQLAVPAREWFLAGMVRIALADGPLTEEERMAARHVASNLGLTAAHAYGVITMTEESATAE
jgi:uncharacterized tellurite resistance protein B-like protein